MKLNYKSRRMKLMEKMGYFDFNNDFIVERAIGINDLCKAFSLVYNCYVEEGYIKPNSLGMRIRIYDLFPENATFIVKKKEEIIGTISLVIDSDDFGIPSDKIFLKEINNLRKSYVKLCEGSNWAISSKYRRSCIITELTRCCLSQAVFIQANILLAMISPIHKSYYNLLGFKQDGIEMDYFLETNDRVVLFYLIINELNKRFKNIDINENNDESILKKIYIINNPYYSKVKLWNKISQNYFSNFLFLHELFVNRTHFLNNCSEKELSLISKHWGKEIFSQVINKN